MSVLSDTTMLSLRTVGLIAALVVGTMGAMGCGGSDGSTAEAEEQDGYEVGEPLDDSTLAAVVVSEYGSDTLYADVFNQQLSYVMQQMQASGADAGATDEIRRNVVESFLTRHVLAGEAERLGVEADSAQVQARIDQIRGQFPDEESFQSVLSARGMTMDSLRQTLGEQMRLQELQQQYYDAAEQPTDEDVEQFQQEQSEEVRAQHILFSTQGAGEEEKAAIREEAEAVLDSAQSGVDFGELASRHSDDGTASRGGDLGYFSKGQMVPPFEEAAFALADSGDVTQDLVETRFGYHIIRLTGRRTAAPMDTSQARSMIMQERGREAVEENLNRLQEKAVVHLNPDVVQVDLEE